MVDLEKIRVFYYVALEGSLLKASSLLGLSSPSISKHLSDLERQLNVKLFIRKRRGLQLTDAGEKLMNVANHAIKDLEEVSSEIATIDTAKPNVLRIVTTTGSASLWLIERLKKFTDLNPDIQIKIYTSDENVDFLNSKADVGILPKVKDLSGLTMRKVKTFPVRLYASKEYLKKMDTPKSISDLRYHRLLSFYHEEVGFRGNIDWHLSLTGKRMKPSLTINNAFGLFQAVRSGLGMCCIATDFPFLSVSDLVEILPDEIHTEVDTYFVTRAEQRDSSIITQLFNCLTE